MIALLRHSSSIPLFLLWSFLWIMGGLWIVRSSFRLYKREETLAGIAVGAVLENFFTNLIAQVISLVPAIWVASSLVFVIGVAFSFPFSKEKLKGMFRFSIYPGQIIVLLGLTYVLTIVGRGMAILDDYQNLPIASVLATGDIPPHFPLDPSVQMNYHYFDLLFSAQLMRVLGLNVWTAVDLVRGFGRSLSVVLASLWIWRITRSGLAAFIAGSFGLFSGGTRWLMLLLPVGLLQKISANLHMIGTGAATAPDFFTALTSPTGIDGAGSFPLPFAYFNGMNYPSVWLYHAGAGAISGSIGSFLLLSYNRWRDWRGGAALVMLLAARAISTETSIVNLALGLGVVAVIYMIVNRSFKIPSTLLKWTYLLIPAGIIIAFQGGVLTGVVSGFLSKLAGQASSSYFSFTFAMSWPPSFLSSHLGELSLGNPYQLITALFEIGPMIIVLPLVFIWGYKAFRAGRWYEAAVIVLPLVYIPILLIQYTGNAGPTALNRLQSKLYGLASGNFAIASLWLWGKNRKEWVKAGIAFLLFIAMFGGIVLFGLELISAPKPVYSYYLSSLDAQMEAKYWDKLEKDAVIYDPITSRPAVVFGRPTDSGITWYENKPEWEVLSSHPDPVKLSDAGFDYVYVGFEHWDKHEAEYQRMLETPCVKLVDEVVFDGYPYDFRRLMDIRACKSSP